MVIESLVVLKGFPSKIIHVSAFRDHLLMLLDSVKHVHRLDSVTGKILSIVAIIMIFLIQNVFVLTRK